MADTFSNLLRLRLQQTGGNNNTWGALLNAASAQLLEDAIAGVANIVVAGSDITLSSVNGANDQSRMAALNLSGSPGAARNIIVPALSKPYIVVNSTGFDMTVKTAAGTGVTVPNGARQYVYCNGTNVVAVQADVLGNVATATNALQLGGVLAANYARRDAFNQHTRGFATTFSALTDGSTVTADCTLSNRFRVVLAGNRALALTNPADGQTIEIWFVQDAGGNRTIAWPANVRFGIGSSAALSTAANAVDTYKLTYHQASDLWVATAARNAAAASGASTFDLSLPSNSLDMRIFELVGSPGGIVEINLTIPAGVRVLASSTSAYALDTTGFASGSTINLFNGGHIIGRGGAGAMGSGYSSQGDDMGNRGRRGENGGAAILGPGAGRTLNIHNASGFIWGGGGGGGGGGCTVNNGQTSCGGGGGGGAGFGSGGMEGSALGQFNNVGVSGNRGAAGTYDSGGAGGTGASTGGSGGTGGAGGGPGDAGSAGASPTSSTHSAAGGAGGSAGNAVAVNGATVTFVSGGSAPNVEGAVS